jgi:hypothetical protein
VVGAFLGAMRAIALIPTVFTVFGGRNELLDHVAPLVFKFIEGDGDLERFALFDGPDDMAMQLSADQAGNIKSERNLLGQARQSKGDHRQAAGGQIHENRGDGGIVPFTFEIDEFGNAEMQWKAWMATSFLSGAHDRVSPSKLNLF